MAKANKKSKIVTPVLLRIGLGDDLGFTKVEHFQNYADNSVDSICSVFHFHRLTQEQRWAFMNETFRVLKAQSPLVVIVPYWTSARAISDPLAQFPPLCENSFSVYNKKFREQEQLTELPLSCDFADIFGVGYNEDQSVVAGRNPEFIHDARKHKLNVILDLHVTMTKNVQDV